MNQQMADCYFICMEMLIKNSHKCANPVLSVNGIIV